MLVLLCIQVEENVTGNDSAENRISSSKKSWSTYLLNTKKRDLLLDFVLCQRTPLTAIWECKKKKKNQRKVSQTTFGLILQLFCRITLNCLVCAERQLLLFAEVSIASDPPSFADTPPTRWRSLLWHAPRTVLLPKLRLALFSFVHPPKTSEREL